MARTGAHEIRLARQAERRPAPAPWGGGPADVTATQPGREQHGVDDLDTQAFEALYYRARLILGEPLPRPARFQLRGH